MWRPTKQDVDCGTILCIVSGTLTVFVVLYLATVRTAECKLTGCVVVEGRCASRGVSFPCYSSQVTYAFTYDDERFEYSFFSTQKVKFEAANSTCAFIDSAVNSTDSDLLPIPQICSFYVYDIQGTISFGDVQYTFFITLLIVFLLVCLCTSCNFYLKCWTQRPDSNV